ncbi:hypothetical protein KCU73_g997, partial [Aureobasidium melanogenum]
MVSVPSLDFEDYLSGGDRRAASCAAFVYSLSASGFVKIRNHELGQKSIDDAFAWAKPEILRPACGGQTKGKTPSTIESAQRLQSALHELKEAWDQGAPDDPENDNLWPDRTDIPGFQDFMEDFFEKSHKTLLTLLRALTVDLGLEEMHFEDRLTTRVYELRLIHYPPTDPRVLEDATMTRALNHTDFGLLTLLWQDSMGGLEIEEQNNFEVFCPVIIENKEMIVNIGDSLMRWTNGQLNADVYRIVLPQLKSAIGEPAMLPGRRSIVFLWKIRPGWFC